MAYEKWRFFSHRKVNWKSFAWKCVKWFLPHFAYCISFHQKYERRSFHVHRIINSFNCVPWKETCHIYICVYGYESYFSNANELRTKHTQTHRRSNNHRTHVHKLMEYLLRMNVSNWIWFLVDGFEWRAPTTNDGSICNENKFVVYCGKSLALWKYVFFRPEKSS